MKVKADKPKHASVKACPFCGNREWGDFNAVIDESFNVQIKCGGCGALGPVVNLARCENRSKARDLACMKWDKRASQGAARGSKHD